MPHAGVIFYLSRHAPAHSIHSKRERASRNGERGLLYYRFVKENRVMKRNRVVNSRRKAPSATSFLL